METPRSPTFDVEAIIAPIRRATAEFALVVVALLAVVAVGAYAYVLQFTEGLGVTGLNRPVFWGVYIGNFVCFVSISLAGTLVSAILRLVHAEWRRPITRCAELVTVLSLLFAMVSVVVDMGRPDRLLNVAMYPHLTSPILWDVASINLYLVASVLYLYLPLIPDIAYLRDRGVGFHGLYRVLALGYRGTPRARRWLDRCVSVMAVAIIPIGISVHTVTAWLFATTVQPVWHSTILGPFFVVAALYTGTAVLVIIVALLRWALDLRHILKEVHFRNLGFLLLAEGCLMLYFFACIYTVEIMGQDPQVIGIVLSEVTGPFAVPFWVTVLFGILLPPLLLAFPAGRTIRGTVLCSILIVGAMWIERFLIVVPPLSNPRLPWGTGMYAPTWVEWAITAGCMAGFALLYLLFTRVFPIVSISEVQEGIDDGLHRMQKRFNRYLPEPVLKR